MMKNWMRWLTAVFAALLLAACGGGGGGTGGFGGGGGGAGGGGAVTASDLTVAASKATLSNTGTDSVTLTVTALDGSRNTLAGATVAFAVDNGAVITPAGTTTGTTGTLAATVGIGADRSNRLVTATITSGDITRRLTIQVTGTQIRATLVPGTVAAGTSARLDYVIVDANAIPLTNQAITVTAPGLTPSSRSGSTDASGAFRFDFTAPSPTEATDFTVSAVAAGVDQGTIFRVGATPAAVGAGVAVFPSVTANPIVVSVNASGSTANQSTIRALFGGGGDLRVANVRTVFRVEPTGVGLGEMSTGNNIVYSNSDGIAVSNFIPGTRSSATSGVTIRACWGRDDATARACTTSVTTRLTISNEPLSVSIGTNELIDPSSTDGLAYEKSYLVTVVDSAGQPKADVALSAIIDRTNFRKGSYSRVGDRWIKTFVDSTVAPPVVEEGDVVVCPNEDENRNGIIEPRADGGPDTIPALETDEDGFPEDEAPEAYKLRPAAADVAVILDSARTRADGTAVLRIRYPKNVGSWVDVRITVSASGVSGTEGRASTLVAPVPVDAASITAETPPAFIDSPYGKVGPETSPIIGSGCHTRR